ncbi:MAG: hypothetical protein LBH44_02875 [Treponema sp.]|nr:hypothetical protein [Treponema sp.]
MFLMPFILGAQDFGLVISQYSGIDNKRNDDTNFEYDADLLPSFEFLLGDSGELFLSAGITLGWKNNDDGFFWMPELLNAEFSWRQGNAEIRAGRMGYADPLGFIAAGLFDGARFSYSSTAGIISIGAWYTGLLYKKSAYITMTDAEQDAYTAEVDLADPQTYFASRRLLASLDWEHPSAAQLLHLKAALTAQFDLTDDDDTYNSQYITLKASIPFNRLTFELGGSLETAELDIAGVKDTNIALAGDAGIYWMLPANFDSLLSLTARYLSGNTLGIGGAFIPLTNGFYGDILKAKLSSLSVLSLNYTMRFTPAFTLGLNASHFIRNDMVTYKAYPVNTENNAGSSLGTEFFAQLVWSPFSDLQINLGGGAFLPALGNAASSDEKPWWSVELSVVFALF